MYSQRSSDVSETASHHEQQQLLKEFEDFQRFRQFVKMKRSITSDRKSQEKSTVINESTVESQLPHSGKAKRMAPVTSVVDNDKENEPPAKRQRKLPNEAKLGKMSPKERAAAKQSSKLFNDMDPNCKGLKIENVAGEIRSYEVDQPYDTGASPLKEEQPTRDKANDFSIDESSQHLQEVFPDESMSSNDLLKNQMNDMAEELELEQHPSKKPGFSPLSSGLKSGEKKFRMSATPFQPKSKDRLTNLEPAQAAPPSIAPCPNALLGALSQVGGPAFNEQAMKKVHEAAGFLPLIKLVLASLSGATQVQLTKYLLSLQPRNDSKDPSTDYLELRAQYETIVDELTQKKTIIDQLKEQHLEKIAEGKKQIERIATLEDEVRRLRAQLIIQESRDEVEKEFAAFEKARKSQCLSYQKTQGVASGGPSRFQRNAHQAEANNSNMRRASQSGRSFSKKSILRHSDNVSWTEFNADGSQGPRQYQAPKGQMSNKKPFDYKEKRNGGGANASAESKLNSLVEEQSERSMRKIDVLNRSSASLVQEEKRSHEVKKEIYMAPSKGTFNQDGDKRSSSGCATPFEEKAEQHERMRLRDTVLEAHVNKSEEKPLPDQLKSLDEDEESEYQLIPLSEIKPPTNQQKHQDRDEVWRPMHQARQASMQRGNSKQRHEQPARRRSNQREQRSNRHYGAVQQELPELDESSIAPVSSRQANEDNTVQAERNSPCLREQATMLTNKLSEERKFDGAQVNQQQDDLESFILERSLMVQECQRNSVDEDQKRSQQASNAEDTKLDITQDYDNAEQLGDDYYAETEVKQIAQSASKHNEAAELRSVAEADESHEASRKNVRVTKVAIDNVNRCLQPANMMQRAENMAVMQEKPQPVAKVEEAPAATAILPKEPREIVPASQLSSQAKSLIKKLHDCIDSQEHAEMSDLLFDIECDDQLSAQIDLEWFEARCVQLQQAAKGI